MRSGSVLYLVMCGLAIACGLLGVSSQQDVAASNREASSERITSGTSRVRTSLHSRTLLLDVHIPDIHIELKKEAPAPRPSGFAPEHAPEAAQAPKGENLLATPPPWLQETLAPSPIREVVAPAVVPALQTLAPGRKLS